MVFFEVIVQVVLSMMESIFLFMPIILMKIRMFWTKLHVDENYIFVKYYSENPLQADQVLNHYLMDNILHIIMLEIEMINFLFSIIIKHIQNISYNMIVNNTIIIIWTEMLFLSVYLNKFLFD